MSDLEKKIVDAAGKALGDSNAYVQEKGPEAVSKIKKVLPYVGAGLAVLVLIAIFFGR